MMKQSFSLNALGVSAGIVASVLLMAAANGVEAAPGQVAPKSAGPRVVIGGNSVSQTLFVYDEPNSTVGSSTTYTTLPGMSAPLVIGGTRGKLVIATFGAESACFGGDRDSPDWCVTRILATDGVSQFVFDPTVGNGTDFAFDSTDNGTETSASWEAHQMTRGRLLKPGTYKIEVEARVKQFGVATPTFWTGERTLTVQVIER